MSTDFKKKTSAQLRERLHRLQSNEPRRPRSKAALREFELKQLVHELQVHQIELEMQNRQLIETQAELENSRDGYSDLYNFAPVSYLDLDERGKIKKVNLTGTELLRTPRLEVVGKPLSRFLRPADRTRFSDCLEACRKTQQKQTLEVELQAGKQLFHHVELSIVPSQSREHDRWSYRTVLIDIAQRKRAEAQIRANQAELETRVKSRTAELARATSSLRAEMAERKEAQEARQQLYRELTNIQENQRRHISRELHDQMGQHLTALSIGLKTLETSVQNESGTKQIRELQKLAAEIGREIHRIAFELSPPALDDLGLIPMLANYLEDWSEHFGVIVDFHQADTIKARLPTEIETTIYRIVQEALTNILKHAKANHVSVILSQEGNHLSIVIEDNGKGFDPKRLADSAPHALGLAGMQERIVLAGGTFQVESTPGKGTALFVRLPSIPPAG